MTEKRFTHKKWYDERQIFDNKEAIAIVDSYTQAEILCNKLNKLHREIEYWKEKHLQEVERNSTISATIDNHNNWHDNRCVFLKQIKELKKENEQLKRFITSMGFTIEKENGTIIRATKEIKK